MAKIPVRVDAKATAVLPCYCEHEYQDKKYGKGKRLFNRCGKGMSISWKCTVCRKEST